MAAALFYIIAWLGIFTVAAVISSLIDYLFI